MSASPQCPQCGSSLKDDYGMVTCESCGTISLVDMDGVAHVSSDPSAESLESSSESQAFEPIAESEEVPVPIEPLQDFDMPSSDSSSEPEEASAWEAAPIEAPMDIPNSLSGLDPMSDPGLAPETEPEAAAESSHEEPPGAVAATEEEFNMDALLGYQQEESEEPDQSPEGMPQNDEVAPAGDPLGLNEYANSELSQATDGLLVFKLLISGIDSKEIRESLREAMEDARFGWDVASIIGLIDKGQLVIENVSPVKATILINRIKRLPIQIRWEQYAITQLEEGDSF